MTNSQKAQQTLYSQQAAQQPPNASGIPRNVSFAKDSNESTAYREHNPPTVLRRQEAARRELSPSTDSINEESSNRERTKFQVGNENPENIASTPNEPAVSASGTLRPVSSGGSSTAPKSDILSRPIQENVNGEQEAKKPATAAPKTQVTLKHPDGPTHQLTQGHRSAAASHTSLASTGGSAQSSQPPNTQQHFTSAEEKAEANKQDEVHILVAVTGSVATIKLPQIVHKLKQIYRKQAAIQIVVTRASTTFFDTSDLPRDIKIWYDSDEWRSRQAPVSTSEPGSHSDQQLHIRLRRWADILLVAPCSANTLAKFTYGICDNLLTSIFRVWNPEVPILLAPAMNTHMYTNPVTKLHFNILKESYPFVEILKPVEKVLVCGDIGMGGMREWTDIVQILVKRVGVALEDEDEDEEDSEDEEPGKKQGKR